MYQENQAIWRSTDTGDYMTPDVVRSGCLLAIRSRENGNVMHLDKMALAKAGLEADPALYLFVTGVVPGAELPRVTSAQATEGPDSCIKSSPASSSGTVTQQEPKAAPAASSSKQGATAKRESPRATPAQAQAEPPTKKTTEGKSMKIDLEDDAVVEADVKHTLKEKKALCCPGCQTELSENTLVCSLCARTTTGQRHEAGKEAVLRTLYKFAPVTRRFVDRGGRSQDGHYRDQCKKGARRARQMNKGYGVDTGRPNPERPGENLWTMCLQMRWDLDETFRNQMTDAQHTREDFVQMDLCAESAGIPPPKKGDGKGRSRQDREATEGY